MQGSDGEKMDPRPGPTLRFENVSNDPPPVPSLLPLGSAASAPQLAPTSVPALNFGFGNPNPSVPSLAIAGETVPGLGLAGSGRLDLSRLPPAASRKEKHEIVICVPYIDLETDAQLSEFRQTARKLFGDVSVCECPIERVIVEPNGEQSAIPSLQAIDAAYQESEHLPLLIDQANDECSKLSHQIELSITEMEALKTEREALKVGNAVLEERIRSVQEDSRRFADAAVRVKRDFDNFVAKVSGTH